MQPERSGKTAAFHFRPPTESVRRQLAALTLGHQRVEVLLCTATFAQFLETRTAPSETFDQTLEIPELVHVLGPAAGVSPLEMASRALARELTAFRDLVPGSSLIEPEADPDYSTWFSVPSRPPTAKDVDESKVTLRVVPPPLKVGAWRYVVRTHNFYYGRQVDERSLDMHVLDRFWKAERPDGACREDSEQDVVDQVKGRWEKRREARQTPEKKAAQATAEAAKLKQAAEAAEASLLQAGQTYRSLGGEVPDAHVPAQTAPTVPVTPSAGLADEDIDMADASQIRGGVTSMDVDAL
jgi:hypothetical protein